MGNLLNNKSIVFFDTETVCIKSHHGVDCLLSLSMIKDYSNGNSERKDFKFKMEGNKLNYVEPEALKVNGYTESGWSDAVSFSEVAVEIAEFIHNCPLVAHNIDFDLRHLRNAFLENGWRQLDSWSRNMKEEHENKMYSLGKPFIDTQALSFMFLPCQRQSLNEVRKHLGISQDRSHSADTDTEDCRAAFYYIVNNTINNNVNIE